jgi:hypothetical protein
VHALMASQGSIPEQKQQHGLNQVTRLLLP